MDNVRGNGSPGGTGLKGQVEGLENRRMLTSVNGRARKEGEGGRTAGRRGGRLAASSERMVSLLWLKKEAVRS